MLKALLRKDIRLLRTYLVFGIVLLFTSYAMPLVLFLVLPIDDFNANTYARVAMGLSGGSLFALILAGCACAVISGNAFTLERMDRSARFLDYLPPTRPQILSSKAIVVVGFLLLVISVSLATVVLAWSLTSYATIPEQRIVPIRTIVNFSKVLICITGAGWAISTVSRSNGAPILLGLFSPFVILAAVKLADYLLDYAPTGELLFARVCNASLLVGVAGFVLGWNWFLKQRYEN